MFIVRELSSTLHSFPVSRGRTVGGGSTVGILTRKVLHEIDIQQWWVMDGEITINSLDFPTNERLKVDEWNPRINTESPYRETPFNGWALQNAGGSVARL